MKKKVYVIGSISNYSRITKAAYEYTEMGNDVNYVFPQPDKSLKELIVDCFHRIREADLIVVVVKDDGSIGDGVTYEIVYAESLGKDIIYYHNITIY